MQKTEKMAEILCPYFDTDKSQLGVLKSTGNCMLHYFVLKKIPTLSLMVTWAYWKSRRPPRVMETSPGHDNWSFKNSGRWTCQHVACLLLFHATWINLVCPLKLLTEEKKNFSFFAFLHSIARTYVHMQWRIMQPMTYAYVCMRRNNAIVHTCGEWKFNGSNYRGCFAFFCIRNDPDPDATIACNGECKNNSRNSTERIIKSNLHFLSFY